MKLHLNLPNHLQFEISVARVFQISDSNTNDINTIAKIKQRIIKLYPHHWFDGVWENLDFKM